MFFSPRPNILVSLCLAIVLGACTTTAVPTLTPEPDRPVTLQLSWFPTIEYAGIYEAMDNNYYAAANLDVTFLSGGFDDSGFINPVESVIDGKAQFGIAGSDAILLERAKGNKLVAIASIYQRNPLAYMSLATSNIQSPQDLIGKRILIEPGISIDINLTALLKSQNIDRSQIIEVQEDPSHDLDHLINGVVDAIPVFITNQPVEMRSRGIEYNLILPSDYGIGVYSNVIFTTEEIIKTSPQLVEDFLRATLKGWNDAIADPEHAAALSLIHNDTLDIKNEINSMQASVPLLNVPGRPIGGMLARDWNSTYQTLQNMNLITTPIDVNEAYTLRFLVKIYGAPAQ
jgi:NitT/TauT family transport system substrate-binding protein